MFFLLKFKPITGNDWVSPDDPTIIAENELLGAAESIDAAARKLVGLRPRRSTSDVNYSPSQLFIYFAAF